MAGARRILVSFIAFTQTTEAAFNQIFFNNSPDAAACPGQAFACQAPLGVCAYDRARDSYYCCEPNDTDGVCWHGATTCGSSDTITCGSGASQYCCLSGGTEQCTQTRGQINICWATQSNPLGNITSHQLNETYSSLLAASPRATALTLNVASLTATATSTSTTASTASTSTSVSSIASTASAVAAPLQTATSNGSTSSSVSSGAIAGIVIGVLALLALAVLAFVLTTRRRRRGLQVAPIVGAVEHSHQSGSTGTAGFYAPIDTRRPDEKAQMATTQMSADIPLMHELTATHERVELPGYGPRPGMVQTPIAELPSSRLM